MRIIVYGVGAIGGTIAARLAEHGQDVAGIARGRQLQAIRDSGLTLKTPDRTFTSHFECAEGPSELGLRDDDVIFLCVKGQDTEGALRDLRAAGAVKQPIFCFQNGVNNERLALRHFENVYGVTVMMPADYETPGTVCGFGTPRSGIFDIGRYPMGRDDLCEDIARRLHDAGLAGFVLDDVMASKYGKLLMNLTNVLDAGFADEAAYKPWLERARSEALEAYGAAGVRWTDIGGDDARRKTYMRMAEIPGVTRVGSSSKQSLVRQAGSIETDYLNGEIVLLGRLHGVPVPVNAALCRIGRKLAAGELEIGKVTDADIEAELAAGSARRPHQSFT